MPSMFVTPVSMRVMGSMPKGHDAGRQGTEREWGRDVERLQKPSCKEKSGPGTGKLKGQWSDQEGN